MSNLYRIGSCLQSKNGKNNKLKINLWVQFYKELIKLNYWKKWIRLINKKIKDFIHFLKTKNKKLMWQK